MATEGEAKPVAEAEAYKPSEWTEVSPPEYLKEVTDLNFVNISIKGYEKKTTSGFPKEEYYAYHIVAM